MAVASKPKSSRKPKSPEVTLSSVYASYAAKREIDTTRAAKLVRSKLRANFEAVCKASPNVKQHKQAANDKKPWPKTITRELAETLLA